MAYLTWKLGTDAYLRIYVTDANGNAVTGATGTVTLNAEDGTELDTGSISEEGSGYYIFALDPTLTVSQGDKLMAEVDVDGAGKSSYQELSIFVQVDRS